MVSTYKNNMTCASAQREPGPTSPAHTKKCDTRNKKCDLCNMTIKHAWLF